MQVRSVKRKKTAYSCATVRLSADQQQIYPEPLTFEEKRLGNSRG
jgi:hypothetical protein